MVNYLGHAGSMGGSYVDYTIVDPVVAPPEHIAAGLFAESTVTLPLTYQVTHYRPDPNLCVGVGAACRRPTRAKFGLPQDPGTLVIANFNGHLKSDPTIFGVWMSLLKRFPQAVLWLMEVRGILQGTIQSAL